MPRTLSTVAAAFWREVAAQRLNRFLHVHLGLAVIAGLLPMFTPGDAERSAPLWVMQAVLYCLSLSSLLLGLSAAHAEAEEHEMLFAQPISRRAYLCGKSGALMVVIVPASLVLVVPTTLVSGLSPALAVLVASAAGVSLTLAFIGLALGYWVRDHVRGLLSALAVWFALLFGADLVLLALAGAPWVQAQRVVWVALVMSNPLDAFRIAVLFAVEQSAFAGIEAGRLVTWWLAHAGLWLALMLSAWIVAAFATAVAGANRRADV